ncbi:MAG: glycosyltransferase family 2 protein, partial [Alphaproteobacteria bacterium]
TNMAVSAYGDDCPFFIRLDAHAHYPPGFLGRLIDAYNTSTADAVTVAMHAVAKPGAFFHAATAAAQNSVLGNGGSKHRAAGVRRWVDHGHHALFKTALFRSVGGYDESFTHNEDAELDARITGAGGRILLAADIVMDYFPRATARGLAKQYFNYGAGRAKTAMKHRMRLKLRQLAPILVAPTALLALLAPAWPIAAAPFALWLTLCVLYGGVLGLRAGKLSIAFSGFPAALMHFCWSLGYWRQLMLSGGAGKSAQPTSASEKA